MLLRFLFCILLVGATFAAHGAPAPAGGYHLPPITVTIKDITPRFVAFYKAVESEHASPDRRWELWKKMYDFAAVPPTPEGEKMARKLLDDAWPRYAAALGLIRKGASSLSPDPGSVVRSISELLRPDKPIKVRLLVYVGGFEGNAFTAASNGEVTTAIPIEMVPAARARILAHELTHAVHINMGSLSGGWVRTIGATVLSEGLAMRVAQKLFVGEPDSHFVELTPGWLQMAKGKQDEILKGILPFLGSSKSEDVMRFTMGHGPAGLEREAYYVGWLVVGYWLDHDMTFADIARILEKDMPQRVTEAVQGLIEQDNSMATKPE